MLSLFSLMEQLVGLSEHALEEERCLIKWMDSLCKEEFNHVNVKLILVNLKDITVGAVVVMT